MFSPTHIQLTLNRLVFVVQIHIFVIKKTLIFFITGRKILGVENKNKIHQFKM